MSDPSQILRALGQNDRESEELARQQEQIPQLIAEAEAKAQAARDILSADRKRLEDTEQARRANEAELQDCESRREKYQSQTALVKTNEEYTVLLREIDGVTARISAIEDEILSGMEAIEELGERLAVVEVEQRQVEQSLVSEAEQQRERLLGVARDAEAREKEREQLVAPLPPALQSQYHRIRARHGSGTALIAGRSCGGCHRHLPYERINRVVAGEILACENCQRILIPADE